jgi:hypothetical protein
MKFQILKKPNFVLQTQKSYSILFRIKKFMFLKKAVAVQTFLLPLLMKTAIFLATLGVFQVMTSLMGKVLIQQNLNKPFGKIKKKPRILRGFYMF